MKILFLDWSCFNKDDTVNALKAMGHEVIKFCEEGYNDLDNDEFLSKLSKAIKEYKPDCGFTYNYYPLFATAFKEENLPCISFIYDNPYVYLYSYTLAFPTNHVFVFDRSWAEEFNRGGLTNVHYMVLPGNADKLPGINRKLYNPVRTKCDVSFVGTLYNEAHNFYERMEEKITPYLKGYLEGVIEAQLKLYGMSIVEGALRGGILDELQKQFPIEDYGRSVEPKGYRHINYFVKRKATQIERMRLLHLLGERIGDKYDIKLFTIDPNYKVKGIHNMGVTPYETEMPFVFKDSRINLNISLRSINTGIPLRCIDILSCGGFLLSNYQEDLVTDFVPGEDFDFFGDPEEMIEKCEYYLSHEKERAEIALNGQNKVRENYSFEAVFSRIFNIVFGDNRG